LSNEFDASDFRSSSGETVFLHHSKEGEAGFMNDRGLPDSHSQQNLCWNLNLSPLASYDI
jgi:hypothetical protein